MLEVNSLALDPLLEDGNALGRQLIANGMLNFLNWDVGRLIANDAVSRIDPPAIKIEVAGAFVSIGRVEKKNGRMPS